MARKRDAEPEPARTEDRRLAGPFRGARMSKASKKSPRKTAIKQRGTASPSQAEFDEVLALIDAAKARAFAAVNTTLIDLYWQLGEYIGHKIAAATWGAANRRSPGRIHPAASPGKERVLGEQPVANATVFRDLPRRAKTRTTRARIALDPQLPTPYCPLPTRKAMIFGNLRPDRPTSPSDR
jgi:hypothetical protein